METKRKRNKQRCLVAGLAIMLAVLSTGIFVESILAQNLGINSAKKTEPLPGPAVPEPAAKSDVYTVAEGEIVTRVVLTGELSAKHSVEITVPEMRSFPFSEITSFADEGSQIKRGDRIVEFDDSELLSKLSESERKLEEAKLTIEKKKIDLEAERCDLLNSVVQAEADLEVAELYGRISKDLLPANTYQQYQLNLEKAKLSLQKAQEQLDNFEKTYESQMALVEIDRSQTEIELKKTENDIRLLKIDAPQDGILIYGDNWHENRKMQVGDNVHEGETVAKLPDLSSMQVVGYVYDTEYGLLSRGMRGTITLDALPGFKMDGEIVSLTNVGSRKGYASEKKVFKATVRPDKVTKEMMRPGMTARVIFPIVLAKEVPAVPREYIGTDSQSRYYVYKGTDAETAGMEYVQVGNVGDRFAQVVSGVSVGDLLLPIQYTEEVLQ